MYEALGTWIPYFALGAMIGALVGVGAAVARKTRTILPAAVITVGLLLSFGVIVGVEATVGPTAAGDRVVLSVATIAGTVVGAFLGSFPIVYARWVERIFASANRRAKINDGH